MAISPFAGKPATRDMLVDLARLEREYYGRKPDVGDQNQLVSFGTSGHRGSSLRGSFNEAHISAIWRFDRPRTSRSSTSNSLPVRPAMLFWRRGT